MLLGANDITKFKSPLINGEMYSLKKKLCPGLNHEVEKRDQGPLYCSRSYTIINSVIVKVKIDVD